MALEGGGTLYRSLTDQAHLSTVAAQLSRLAATYSTSEV